MFQANLQCFGMHSNLYCPAAKTLCDHHLLMLQRSAHEKGRSHEHMDPVFSKASIGFGMS